MAGIMGCNTTIIAAGAVVCLLISSTSPAHAYGIYNVADFGAVGNDRTDNSEAFQRAWIAACSDAGSPMFLVPSPGIFLVASQITFSGPCRAQSIHFQVAGTVSAPRHLWTRKVGTAWIMFKSITGLTVYGSGKFDGRGFDWWTCKLSRRCSSAPDAVAFAFCDGLHLSGLTFSNSPAKHLTLYKSQWVKISGIKVLSPANSPNTDGILVAESRHVQLTWSRFHSGDDCVAIGTGTYDFNISNIDCGPGHGISIGSLGMGGSRAEVENVRVTDSHISNTLFGARIKTWSGGSGYARGILFKNIIFKAVQFPLIIDQFYCGSYTGCPNKTASVEVSNVEFVDLVGTTMSDKPIRLECSNTVPCRGVLLDHVVFSPAGLTRRLLSSSCNNVRGSARNKVVPQVPCLG